MPRTMNLLNQTGDITIGWGEGDDVHMLPMIEEKLRQGYSFFIVKGEDEVRLKRVDQIGDVRKVVLSDKEAERLFAAGRVGLVEKAKGAVRGVVDTIRRSTTAEEIVRHDTVAMRPMAGG